MAVDGWAVDYVRLDSAGDPSPFRFAIATREPNRRKFEVHAILPAARLYGLTGIQILRINTMYQLFADKLAGCDPALAVA